MVTLTELLENIKGLIDKFYIRKNLNHKSNDNDKYPINGVVVTDNNREITVTQSISANSTRISGLSPVATSNNYNDLTNKPTKLSDFTIDNITATQTQTQTNNSYKIGDIKIGNTTTTFYGVDTNTTYDIVTTNNNGLMSKGDKQKLDNIESNANNYVHPTYIASYIGNISNVQLNFGDSFNTQIVGTDNTGHINDRDTQKYTLPSLKIGSTANLPVITTTNGALTTGSFGTGTNQFARGDHTHSNYLTSHQDITGKENTNNKVSSITPNTGSTTKYPNIKAIEDYIEYVSKDAWVDEIFSDGNTVFSYKGMTMTFKVNHILKLGIVRCKGTITTMSANTYNPTMLSGYYPETYHRIPIHGTLDIWLIIGSDGGITFEVKSKSDGRTVSGEIMFRLGEHWQF